MTYVVCLCLAQHATLHEWCHWIMCYDCYDSVMTQLWPFRFVFRHACYELLVLDTAISGLALPIWVILCDMAYYWRHGPSFQIWGATSHTKPYLMCEALPQCLWPRQKPVSFSWSTVGKSEVSDQRPFEVLPKVHIPLLPASTWSFSIRISLIE